MSQGVSAQRYEVSNRSIHLPPERSPHGVKDEAGTKQTVKATATNEHYSANKAALEGQRRPTDTYHHPPSQICKQEVAGSIPAGSTREMPVNWPVWDWQQPRDTAEIKRDQALLLRGRDKTAFPATLPAGSPGLSSCPLGRGANQSQLRATVSSVPRRNPATRSCRYIDAPSTTKAPPSHLTEQSGFSADASM
jgi:hypothetical protein